MTWWFLMVTLVIACVCENVFSWPHGLAMELYFVSAVSYLGTMVDGLMDIKEK